MVHDQLSPSDRSIWIALASVSGIGTHSLARVAAYLQQQQLSWREWWVSPEVWSESGLRSAQIAALQQWQDNWTLDQYLEYLATCQIQTIIPSDTTYPFLLQQIPDRPAVLFVRGPTEPLNQSRTVAVVGTRKMTQYGAFVTKHLVQGLGVYGAVIVSGSMYGVDVLAHRTAYRQGSQTVAVLAYGHHHPVARDIVQLHEELLAQGSTIVSEYPPWLGANKGTFPARNRIVAGLSKVTVVTEAPEKSGSHITALLAAEYGREVCVVPGPISSLGNGGVLKLVNLGAKLVAHADHIAQEMGWLMIKPSLGCDEISLSSVLTGVCQTLAQTGPQTLSQLTEALEYDSVSLVKMLAQLQTLGLVEQQNAQWGVTGRVWHNDSSS